MTQLLGAGEHGIGQARVAQRERRIGARKKERGIAVIDASCVSQGGQGAVWLAMTLVDHGHAGGATIGIRRIVQDAVRHGEVIAPHRRAQR